MPLSEVEDAASIVRRFVVSAMSVGALSPEAHQALTIGIQRVGGSANTGEGGEDPAWYTPGPDGRRHDARIKQVASARFGVTADLPGPGRPARDQDRPGLQARRGRPAARPQGDGLYRRAPPRPARTELHQPAAAPRHLLDRGPRPADRRPAGDQPAGPDRRQARRRTRGRDDRGGRGQGRRLVHPPVRACRRNGRVAAVLDQARRCALGARPRRGPPGPAPQRPPRSGGAPHGRRPADRTGPPHRGTDRGRGVRVRDRGAGRHRLRHGPAMPPRHVPDRDRHAARGPARQVRRAHPRRSSASSPRSPRISVASWPRSAPDRSARSSARAAGCWPRCPPRGPSWRR